MEALILGIEVEYLDIFDQIPFKTVKWGTKSRLKQKNIIFLKLFY